MKKNAIMVGNYTKVSLRGDGYGFLCTLLRDLPESLIFHDCGNAAIKAIQGSHWVYFKQDILCEKPEYGLKKRIRLRLFEGDLCEATIDGAVITKCIEISYTVFTKYFIADWYDKRGLGLLEQTCVLNNGVATTTVNGKFITMKESDEHVLAAVTQFGYRYIFIPQKQNFFHIPSGDAIDFAKLFEISKTKKIKQITYERFLNKITTNIHLFETSLSIQRICENAILAKEKDDDDIFVIKFSWTDGNGDDMITDLTVRNILTSEALYSVTLSLCYLYDHNIEDICSIHPVPHIINQMTKALDD